MDKEKENGGITNGGGIYTSERGIDVGEAGGEKPGGEKPGGEPVDPSQTGQIVEPTIVEPIRLESPLVAPTGAPSSSSDTGALPELPDPLAAVHGDLKEVLNPFAPSSRIARTPPPEEEENEKEEEKNDKSGEKEKEGEKDITDITMKDGNQEVATTTEQKEEQNGEQKSTAEQQLTEQQQVTEQQLMEQKLLEQTPRELFWGTLWDLCNYDSFVAEIGEIYIKKKAVYDEEPSFF